VTRQFLSCDWGTSSFRIRWVAKGEIVREFQTKDGCRSIHDEALPSGEHRAVLYERFLRRALSNWPPSTDPLPLVISGMASSSIGWLELPYAATPLKLNASNLRFQRLEWNKPGWLAETYLISGLATDNEIMRGEETEAIGLLDEASGTTPSVLILPGTHSKHLLIANGQIESFCTYMTGELFDVLAHHSILKATVDLSHSVTPDSADLGAFDAGVRQAVNMGLGASLFQTRTRAVLKRSQATQNAWFLSGILIGAELADSARRIPKRRVLIAGAKPLRSLYAQAMRLMEGWSWHECSDRAVELAVPTAHRLFLENHGFGSGHS
jgi:2-dehydro-3-deoxygalactonokinase